MLYSPAVHWAGKIARFHLVVGSGVNVGWVFEVRGERVADS